MTLINDTDLKDQFNIASQVSEGQLSFAISAAACTLKSWVGADEYEQAGSETPDDEDAAEALAAAESYLAMYHLLLTTGARIRKDGVIKTEQDAAGPVGGNIVNSYYSPQELKALRNEYYSQAEVFAATYRIAPVAGTGAGTITMEGGWRKCDSDLPTV